MKNFLIAASVLTMAVAGQADAATWISYEVTATGTATFTSWPLYVPVTRNADIKLNFSVQVENTGRDPETGLDVFRDPRTGALYRTNGGSFYAATAPGVFTVDRGFLGMELSRQASGPGSGFFDDYTATIQYLDMLQELGGWPTVAGDYRATGILDFNSVQRGGSTRVFGLITNFRVVGVTDGLYLPYLSLATSVPEPATWAMMIVGVGAVGGMMRRRSAAKVAVSFA